VSYKATNWAYELPLSGSAKGVLVALADMADEENSCYPGQKKLGDMTGRAQRTVQRALDHLEALGLLTRVHRYGANGWRTSDRYVLNLDVVTLDLGDTVTSGQDDYRSMRPVVNLSSLSVNLTEPKRHGDRAEENHQYEPLEEPLEAKSRRKASTRLPDSWLPGEASVIFARHNRIDLNYEVGQFRAHAAANDRKQADWNAAFRLWLGNVVKWRKPTKGAPANVTTQNEWMFR